MCEEKIAPSRLYFNLGNSDDGFGGGSLLGLLSSGKLDLSGNTVEITTALACQSPATVGVLLRQLQTLKRLELKVEPQFKSSIPTVLFTVSSIIT